MSPHGTVVAVVSASLAAAVALVENYRYRGTVVAWLWSLTGWTPMPHEVAVSIAILVLSIVFAVAGLVLFRRDGR